jgi:hypothetical protein
MTNSPETFQTVYTLTFQHLLLKHKDVKIFMINHKILIFKQNSIGPSANFMRFLLNTYILYMSFEKWGII